jgi:hypothetical protein
MDHPTREQRRRETEVRLVQSHADIATSLARTEYRNDVGSRWHACAAGEAATAAEDGERARVSASHRRIVASQTPSPPMSEVRAS